MMADTSTPAGEGLRERKRAATQASIERAAITLALEHGYDNVTVDMICEASMVSQRTFFNYFGSKEGVILGAKPPIPNQEEIEVFAHKRGNILSDFLVMLSAAALDHDPDMELFTARRTLIMRTPELFSKETAQMAEFQDRFVAIVLTRYQEHGRTDDPAELEDEAGMVVALATGVVHYIKQKTLGGPRSPASRELLRRSIDLVHRITEDGNTAAKGTLDPA